MWTLLAGETTAVVIIVVFILVRDISFAYHISVREMLIS